MDYADAMKIVLQGGAARRDDWRRPAHVIKTNLGGVTIITLVMKDGEVGPYSPSNCDRLANDWQRVSIKTVGVLGTGFTVGHTPSKWEDSGADRWEDLEE